jgi:hypothetical protein
LFGDRVIRHAFLGQQNHPAFLGHSLWSCSGTGQRFQLLFGASSTERAMAVGNMTRLNHDQAVLSIVMRDGTLAEIAAPCETQGEAHQPHLISSSYLCLRLHFKSNSATHPGLRLSRDG